MACGFLTSHNLGYTKIENFDTSRAVVSPREEKIFRFEIPVHDIRGVGPIERARGVASCLEGAWRAIPFTKDGPPITVQWLLLTGQQMTLNDSKARKELGYTSHVSREQGLREITEEYQAKQKLSKAAASS